MRPLLTGTTGLSSPVPGEDGTRTFVFDAKALIDPRCNPETMMRHYKLRWEEPDDARQSCWDYWEIDTAGDFTRSVHMYDDGRVLSYDEQHAGDKHGQLPESPLNLDELTPEERATILPISREEFEAAWARPALNRSGGGTPAP